MEESNTRGTNTSLLEFVVMVAAMTALVALTIDAILPGLPDIGRDLNVTDANHTQLIITFIFIGMVIGSLFFGPLSDAIGRKPALSISMVVFLLGSFIAWQSESFSTMLVGRIIQGLGVAGPRIIAIAMVRDRFEGNHLARVMSFINGLFIIMPAIAPSIGQITLAHAGWRALFILFIVVGVSTWVWVMIRQPETNRPENRKPFSFMTVKASFLVVVTTRSTLFHTISLGALFGAFLSYLSASQQIFEQSFGIVADFPKFFAALALGFGLASLLNAKIVMIWGMRFIVIKSLSLFVITSVIFGLTSVYYDGYPPISIFMVFAMITFMALSTSFGNLNALSLNPLGAHAGMGAAFISALSTTIALPIAIFTGALYDGSLYVLAFTFSVCGMIALAISIVIGPDKTTTG